MRSLLLLSAMLFLTLGTLDAQWGREIKGSGNVVTQDREINNFTEIKSCCSMKVIATKGASCSVKVEVDDNLQQYIETQVNGDRLVIKRTGNKNIDPTGRVTVYVTLPELSGLYASSSSDLIVKSPFSGDRLDVDVSSSAEIEVEFTGNRVNVEGSSSGTVRLSGRADRTDVDVSSSARINGQEFTSKELDAEASSSGKVRMKVTNEVDADVSSGGKVEYSGNPSKVHSDESSGGKVRKVQ